MRSVASVQLESSMSMRTKLRPDRAAAAMVATLSRQKPSSTLRPSSVSLIETFELRPRSWMAAKTRKYSSTAASALSRSLTSSPSRSMVAIAPCRLSSATTHKASSRVAPATQRADDEARDQRQRANQQPVEHAHRELSRDGLLRGLAGGIERLGVDHPAHRF